MCVRVRRADPSLIAVVPSVAAAAGHLLLLQTVPAAEDARGARAIGPLADADAVVGGPVAHRMRHHHSRYLGLRRRLRVLRQRRRRLLL